MSVSLVRLWFVLIDATLMEQELRIASARAMQVSMLDTMAGPRAKLTTQLNANGRRYDDVLATTSSFRVTSDPPRAAAIGRRLDGMVAR